MELRRKEHAIRQVSKQMSYMESEKNALVDRLGDSERAMTAAARWVELPAAAKGKRWFSFCHEIVFLLKFTFLFLILSMLKNVHCLELLK